MLHEFKAVHPFICVAWGGWWWLH